MWLKKALKNVTRHKLAITVTRINVTKDDETGHHAVSVTVKKL